MTTGKITTLVLPVGGMGKRLRPLTLRLPKALVSLNGRPLLDYFLEEAETAGIHHVILVINPKHRLYFLKFLKERRKLHGTLRFSIRIQETPGGNGHAILQAADLLGNKPFAVRFCDDILYTKSFSALADLVRVYDAYHASVVLLERVPKDQVSRYGVVKVKRVKSVSGVPTGRIYQVKGIVEKPQRAHAPSNLAIIGGYVLTPEILRNLKRIAETLPVVADDALPLAVAFQIEFIVGGKIFGWEFPYSRLDCGTLETLKTSEEFLKKHSSEVYPHTK